MRRLATVGSVLCLAFVIFSQVALADPLVPDDPKYSYEWYAQSSGTTGSLGLPDAWALSLGDASVIVAILDTGVMTTTPDLAGRLLPALSVTGKAPFSDATLAATTALHHGTWVASVVGMGVDNGIGGAGVGNFSILPITVTDSNGHNMATVVASGIRQAVAAGAKVISISQSVSNYGTLDAAAADALAAGVLVFVSAGNTNAYKDMTDYENLIFVSGTDQNDERWDDGTTGSTWGPFVDLAAPAADILAADPTLSTGYGLGDGTSFAAPLAAGAAALLWSINPDLTAAEVRDLLYTTAVDLGESGWDEVYGWGRLDIGAAAAQAYAMVSVPEPETLALLAAGVGLILARHFSTPWRRRDRQSRQAARRTTSPHPLPTR